MPVALYFTFFIGCIKLESALNQQLHSIERRHVAGQTTIRDKMVLHTLFRGGALGGMFVVPYAGRILRRCINGIQRPLKLQSRYISHKSPKVKESLEALKHKPDGTYRYGGFRQKEDMRLSMAFNPYNLTLTTKGSDRYATLWYDFSWKKIPYSEYTYFPIGPMTLKINDGLVISRCPSYRVEQTWKIQL
jgi:hypothetical protein